MIIRQKVFIILIALLFFIVVIGLVRSRKLREEYSWLWLVTGSGMIFLTLNQSFLKFISAVMGIETISTLFLFAILFLLLLCLQYSLYISDLSNKVKNLTQELALLKAERGEKQEKSKSDF
ncbi:DUF2304 domain-containing protein [Desulfobacula phenolica]|uniref:DUF2304 domain-containing protein n=1 Tax=Desulfobacula phenolica TaxID=90732 RepID=A0A1H2DRW5_9BACT|nr:DUF2304 domain-containing protein [Desulfobacula phenolica]SDT85524.1 hypothetical protein SAMN04487931_10238 [Desulfobacula phenolica]